MHLFSYFVRYLISIQFYGRKLWDFGAAEISTIPAIQPIRGSLTTRHTILVVIRLGLRTCYRHESAVCLPAFCLGLLCRCNQASLCSLKDHTGPFANSFNKRNTNTIVLCSCTSMKPPLQSQCACYIRTAR